jgi:outer membrane protein OmpA-like peptidoglycan-associated protein
VRRKRIPIVRDRRRRQLIVRRTIVGYGRIRADRDVRKQERQLKLELDIMTSMLDNIRELITPATLTRAAALTGESESALRTGFGAAIPAILGTLAKRADDSRFMTELGRLALGASDSDPLTAAKAFRSPTTGGIDTTTPMGGWLSGLFGNNLSSVTDAISRFAGVSSGSAASLLSIGTSLVLGYLGRMMRSDRVDASGLADRLRREQANITAALPPGFNLTGVTNSRSPSNVDAAPALARSAGSWAIPLLLTVLGLGALVWFANRFRPEQTVARVEDTTTKAVGTAGAATRDMLSRTLPGNIKITIPTGGMEDRVAKYVESPSVSGSNTFDFDRIGFMSGSSSLTEESREQIQNIATIMRAYPSVHVTVGGHTDNKGNAAANRELSRARAEAVADALTRTGIPTDRVQPQGFGDSKPIADNSTEAGRTRNRRVTLEVTAR